MRLILIGLALCVAACVSTPEPAAPVRPLQASTAWVAANDEWADEARAVYAEAKAYVLEAAKTRPAKSWAVILDVDETVLNNVGYQIGRDKLEQGYTPESWYAWTQEKRATLVPGVEDFLDTVTKAGGFVAFVTNRSDVEQLATEENLADLGITRHDDFRVLLTRARPDGKSDKSSRFSLVPKMLAVQGYDQVSVIAYIGDNKGDKPAIAGDWTFFCIDQGAMYGDPCAKVPGPGR